MEEKEIKEEISFEDIPVRPVEENKILVVNPETMEVQEKPKPFQQMLEQKVLKPGYHLLKKAAPSFALKMKTRLNGFAQNSGDENNPAQPLKIAGEIKTAGILVDSTQTSRTEFTTGIQRVVRKMVVNFPDNVVIGKSQNGFFATNNLMRAKWKNAALPQNECRIDLAGVKKMILLDSSWEYKEKFEKYIQTVQQGGGSCSSVIYDLIPVRHPELVTSELFAKIFTDWHDMVLQKTDHVMCISKAVADDVIAYYHEKGFKRQKPLAVSYFPLGADLRSAREVNPKFVRKQLQRFFTRPTFLMVGTIEPRKGHMIAFEAFTKLLDRGEEINLLVIGHNGWHNDEIINYIANNKYNKKNLLWLQDASDYELDWAYQHSSCLIAASLEEGYGLPLIEGAQYGIPIICSDIPVFREVSQGYADFFKVFDVDSLAECIEKWLKTEEHPDSRKMKIYTWKEAADIFMEIVEGKREPYQVIS